MASPNNKCNRETNEVHSVGSDEKIVEHDNTHNNAPPLSEIAALKPATLMERLDDMTARKMALFPVAQSGLSQPTNVDMDDVESVDEEVEQAISHTANTDIRGIEEIHDNDIPAPRPITMMERLEDTTARKIALLPKAGSGLRPPVPDSQTIIIMEADMKYHDTKKEKRGVGTQKKQKTSVKTNDNASSSHGNRRNVATTATDAAHRNNTVNQQRRVTVDHAIFEEDDIRNLRTVSYPRISIGNDSARVTRVGGYSNRPSSNRTGTTHHIHNSMPSNDDRDLNEAEIGQHVEMNHNGSLPRIPEAFLVEDDSVDDRDNGRDVIIEAYAEAIPPFWKQTRTKLFCAIMCIVVAAAAVCVGLSYSYNINSDSDGNTTSETNPNMAPTLMLPSSSSSSAPSRRIVPTNDPTTTLSPSSSSAPSSSPTTCAREILSNGQKIDLPLLGPNDPAIALDGRSMVVVAWDFVRGPFAGASVYIVFYSLVEEASGVGSGSRWEMVNFLTEEYAILPEMDDRLYSVALSGTTAIVGLPQSGSMLHYEQNNLGLWVKSHPFMGLGREFGGSVDIDGSLACVSSRENVHVYQQDGQSGSWILVDVVTIGPHRSGWGECFVGGNVVAINTLGHDDSFREQVSPLRAVAIVPYLFLREYDQGIARAVSAEPLQDFHFRTYAEFGFNDFVSIDVSQNDLALLVKKSNGEQQVLMHHRQDIGQQFMLLQNFSSSNYLELAMDKDTLVVGGANQTFIYSQESGDGWVETVVLDQALSNHQVSGRNLFATAPNIETGKEDVYYFNIEDCVQQVPTQVPSLSASPSATPTSVPSGFPIASPSSEPSTSATPTQTPTVSPSALPSATSIPSQTPSTSQIPTETCFWIDIDFSYRFWCNPTWELRRTEYFEGGSLAVVALGPMITSGPVSESVCMPPGEYEFITEQDPEQAVVACCSGNNRGSYSVTSRGAVITEGENCYNEIRTTFSLPFV